MAPSLSRDLLRRLEAIDDLPALPDVLLRLLELCESDGVEVRPIARLIETDAALTAKILGVVNSSSYGLPNRVAGVEQAIVLLGTEAIKSIAICATLSEVMGGSVDRGANGAGAGKAGSLELRRVWRHSLECALLARELARASSFVTPDGIFLAGLLHDVGKHVLLRLFPAEYPRCLARSRASPELLLVDEVRLGALHADVGAWLIRRWGLPPGLAESTESHHEPLHRILDASLHVRFVHGANYLTSLVSDLEASPHERVASLLGLPPATVAEARSRAARELEETARALGVSLEGIEVPSAPEAEEVQARLGREARSVSMLLAALWGITRAADEAAIVQVVFRALSTLFHADAALYFRYSAATDSLRGASSSRRPQPESLEGLLLDRTHSRSIIAESSRSASIRYAFGGTTTIIDAQVCGLLGTEGFACYPLGSRGECVGVLVVGASNGTGEALRRREKPLALLAAEASQALQADRLREREAERIRVERIAAAALVVDRVIQEVRGPLAAIGRCVGALGGSAQTEEARAALSAVTDEVGRVGRVLGRLSGICSERSPALAELDLRATIEAFRPVLARLHAGVEVGFDLAGSLPPVRGSVDYLRQILMNLVRNAAEATPQGGAVLVRTEADPADGGRTVRVVVEDRGVAVPASVRGRLFEPFVTTRGDEHRGLGLSIAHALARGMGGELSYEPLQPTGSRFTLSLPAVDA